MALNYVTVTGTFDDGSGTALNGTVTFTPSQTVYSAGTPVVSTANPINAQVISGALKSPSGGMLQLLATDNTGLTLEGMTGFWFWSVNSALTGQSWSFFLPSSPSTVDLYSLANTAAGGGGFTSPMTTLGDLIYENATPAAARLAGNTTSTKKFLAQTGTGSVSAAPAWGTIAAADVPGTVPVVTFTYGSSGAAPSSGTYATGALAVDQNGIVRVCTSGGTPGTWAREYARPAQFWVFDYGAKGDGSTDDTAAIKSALAAAYTYATGNHGYYELIFDPVTYLLSGATSTGTLGTSGQCKAQIPLPVTATTAQKIVHVWRGATDATALYHWQQTTVQSAGAVLKTTLNASAQFFSIGTEPSVIGGPLPANGYGSTSSLFGNDLFVIDGITISTPNDPQICGFDFRGCAEANVISASALVATSGLIGSITAPSNAQQFGLAMPETNNNDNCNVQMWSAEGQNYSLVASEHTNVWSMRSVYCIAGVVCSGQGGSMPHGIKISYASVEACQIGVQFNYNSANPTKVQIDVLDYEGTSGSFGSFHVINDPNNYGVGDIGILNMSPASPRTSTFDPAANSTLNSGTGLRIWAPDLAKGAITAPAVPLTTVTLLNGSGANAAVTVGAGTATVTAITVDGAPTGVTAGTVIVPANKTIALTYSGGTPVWKWVLF